MSDEINNQISDGIRNGINYKNNPLHGVSLKSLLIEIVDQYDFEILFAYLNINCFKTNASIDSSIKFLKKTDWAREKVEAFYLYEYKNLPRASYEQFALPPRERIIPEEQAPGAPKELSLEDAERLREKRAQKSAERLRQQRISKSTAREPWGEQSSGKKIDPWAR
ncbi:MAG: VF530 family DNA-binding protein [Mariprofundus sp.]|nr:VF530 family DNA-binding protein [Mariprofundus sp.]